MKLSQTLQIITYISEISLLTAKVLALDETEELKLDNADIKYCHV